MPDTIDRLEGARTTFGMKKPVVAATTGAITLSGEQTIDGVACVEDDRVLVKDQASNVFNGIYIVSTGAWTRAVDFDGITDWVKGTLVVAGGGTTNGGKLFRVTSADPTEIDVSAISFESVSFLDSHANGSTTAAATVNLSAIDADAVDVTGGGASITAITITEGYTRIVRFTGANTLTHSATLVLPGALNITTADGDFAIFRGYASSITRCLHYQRADGQPLPTGQSTIASAATVDLGSVRDQSIVISGTTPVSSFGSSAPTGAIKFIRLSGAVPLTDGANLNLPGGLDIQGASGDTFIARHDGSGVWYVMNYTRATYDHATGTDASNGAITESDLRTYSLPASRLADAGSFLKLRAWGITSTASTAATRRIRAYFGATAIADTGAISLVGGVWSLEAVVIRESASAQAAIGTAHFSTGGVSAGSSLSIILTAPAETLTAAVTVKVTGLCTATTGVITQHGFVVEQGTG